MPDVYIDLNPNFECSDEYATQLAKSICSGEGDDLLTDALMFIGARPVEIDGYMERGGLVVGNKVHEPLLSIYDDDHSVMLFEGGYYALAELDPMNPTITYLQPRMH